MLHKSLTTFIVVIISSIAILTIFNAQTIEAEDTKEIAEISAKPSIVALATVVKSFRASLSSELLKNYGIFALNHGPKMLLEHYALEDHHKMNEALFDYSIAGLQHIENMEAH